MTVPKCPAACTLVSAALTAQLISATTAAAQSIDPVVERNRNLVAIVRTPDAQPATIYPTRSLAMLRVAMDDALTACFRSGAVQSYWNEIAQTASLDPHLTTAEDARLFALLNVGCADGVIGFFDAKYTYDRWRSITAVRFAGTEGNPETTRDPSWSPEVGRTTPDRAYPGAHAVISTAAVEVLVAVLERDRLDFTVTSEVLPGVERSFASFSAAAEEAEQGVVDSDGGGR
jgi:hypothetical protein